MREQKKRRAATPSFLGREVFYSIVITFSFASFSALGCCEHAVLLNPLRLVVMMKAF